MSKIMLIDPPFQKFMGFSKGGIPLGLLYLAGKLENEGNQVSTFDADYFPEGSPYPFIGKIERYQRYLWALEDNTHQIWKNLEEKIEEESPEILGLSVISTKAKSAKKVAEIAKKKGVERIIVGGPHATLFPEDLISDKNIDTVVRGEGEYSFKEATQKKGIINSQRIKDLDSLPWPARHTLVNLERYNETDLGMIMSSRGCPGSCNFCCSEALWGKQVRFRDIKDVIKEIDFIQEEYGVKKFYVVDDTFTLRKKRVEYFCDEMGKRDLEWSCLTRVDRIDYGLVQKMVDSGCSMVKVGVESGNQRVLDSMNKGISIQQIEKAGEIFNRQGLNWLAYVMAGVPGEKTSEMLDTINLIKKITPTYVSASIYTPYPGTGFWNGNKAKDMALEEANHHSLISIAGDIPREELKKFMSWADNYNSHKR